MNIMGLIDGYQIVYILRLVLASVCGILIGLERKNRAKEAGVRTHCVVACAAALMMIISKYAFFDVIGEGMYNGVEVRLDPSRVASTIASGIGFLGAGMIFVHKNTVTGLTTAAGIWATSGVGMAIGSGMYLIGISATVIIILAQVILHKNFRWLRASNQKKLSIKEVNMPGFQEHFTALLRSKGVIVHEVGIEKKENGNDYTFIIEIPQFVTEESIVELSDFRCKISNNG